MDLHDIFQTKFSFVQIALQQKIPLSGGLFYILNPIFPSLKGTPTHMICLSQSTKFQINMFENNIMLVYKVLRKSYDFFQFLENSEYFVSHNFESPITKSQKKWEFYSHFSFRLGTRWGRCCHCKTYIWIFANSLREFSFVPRFFGGIFIEGV